MSQIGQKNNAKASKALNNGPEYLLVMKNVTAANKTTPLVLMIPIIVFSAFVILIVRMHIYTRPMGQFFWTPQTDETQLTDFFSYDKMIVILVAACVAFLLVMLHMVYRYYAIKKTVLYIPMLVFIFFVLLSYMFSDYQEFALLGYNDRFEGTITLLCYMFMLFYVINSVNTETNVKQIIWPIAVTSVLLSLLGLTQGLDHDFFRTAFGQKLITPNYVLSDGTTTWQSISDSFAKGELFFNFTFQNKEIYQTVYNINYVSFYLTLLIPLWAMLFIRTLKAGAAEPLWKKIALGLVFALNVYNFIGSVSSGGIIGLFVIVVLAIVIFNKRILKVWKPVAALVLVTAVILACTTSRWVGEISSTLQGIFGSSEEQVATESVQDSAEVEPGSVRPWLDSLHTNENSISIGLNGEELNIILADGVINFFDGDGNAVVCTALEDGRYAFSDDRYYQYLTLIMQTDESSGLMYFVFNVGGTELLFTYDGNQFLFVNDYGNAIALDYDVDHDSFFDKHLGFGSNRGYIWSRSISMLKDSLIIGTGADTFCISFPQGDYAGRYNVNDETWMSIIVDKPHNMYLNTGICTGCISLLAQLALYGIYVVQSFRVYWKRDLGTDFLSYAGIGVFFGTTGFMCSGLVNDSTVSVMPMFYTLLGTGIAINMMLKHRTPEVQK